MTSILHRVPAARVSSGRHPLVRPFGEPARVEHRLRGGRAVLTVRELTTPAPMRVAEVVAGAAMVRDVAAFAALVVLATMLSVLSAADLFV